MVKVNESTGYDQEAMNYVYRLLSAGKSDVAFQILKTIVKSVRPDYIGHAVLEIIKQSKNTINAEQKIESIFKVNFPLDEYVKICWRFILFVHCLLTFMNYSN